MKIYGFSCLKNGLKFDYPFFESWSSLAPLVESTTVAFDPGEDKSLEVLKTIPKVQIIHREWPKDILGGRSIAVMTNYALEEIRAQLKLPQPSSTEPLWGILLQADEVFHQRDLDQVRKDLIEAEKQGYDAVRFKYLHFWQSHYRLAIGKRWYPEEIRAINLNSSIVNEGDGVSFENWKRVYTSDVPIYHYGHVRDQKKYLEKTLEMRKMYYSGFRLKRKLFKVHMGYREKVIPFLGDHPSVMKSRMDRLEDRPKSSKEQSVIIRGDKTSLSSDLVKSLHCKDLTFVEPGESLPRGFTGRVVDLAPQSWMDRILGRGVPRTMDAKDAPPWTKDMDFILQCSAQGLTFF